MGGISSLLWDMVPRLLSAGDEVSVLSRSTATQEESPNIHTSDEWSCPIFRSTAFDRAKEEISPDFYALDLAAKTPSLRAVQRDAINFFSTNQVELVHCHIDVDLAVGLAVGQALDIPVTYALHTVHPPLGERLEFAKWHGHCGPVTKPAADTASCLECIGSEICRSFALCVSSLFSWRRGASTYGVDL